MSMKLMATAMDVKVGNPLRKLVLLKLCDNANDKGECWPSMQHIADQCEISKRSVIGHVKALAEMGFLLVQHRAKDNKKISNLYLISLKKATEFSGAGDAPLTKSVVQEIHQGGAGDSPLSGAGAAHRTSHSLEPVIEPLKACHAAAAAVPRSRVSVDKFFEDKKLYLQTVKTLRPELIEHAELMRSTFTIFWREQKNNIRDDWLDQWCKWVFAEKNI